MEENYKQYGIVSSFIYIIFIFIAAANGSSEEELRPSEHGLAYQESSKPTTTQAQDIPEMVTFFNGKKRTAPLPVAKNLTSSTWWRSDGTDGKSGVQFNKGDRVRMILIVSSLICGLIGILMLITSATVLLLRRYRKKKIKESSPASTSVSNANALVVKVGDAL